MQPNFENYQLLSEYYSDHIAEVRSFIAKRIGEDDDADDLAQDVFLRLLSLQEIITSVTLPSLVYTTARNKVADYWRHRQAVGEHEHYIIAKGASAVSDNNSPESVYSVKEIIGQMEQGMAKLSNPQRIVYRMNMIEGLRVSEISQRLNCNYKTVEHRLGSARKIVRSYINNVRQDAV